MNETTHFFRERKGLACILVFLTLFQTAGCSHLTDIFLINYTNQDADFDISGDRIRVPKHDHLYGKVYLGGASGVHLKITVGLKTLVERDVSKEELNANMIRDDLLIWEIKQPE